MSPKQRNTGNIGIIELALALILTATVYFKHQPPKRAEHLQQLYLAEIVICETHKCC